MADPKHSEPPAEAVKIYSGLMRGFEQAVSRPATQRESKAIARLSKRLFTGQTENDLPTTERQP